MSNKGFYRFIWRWHFYAGIFVVPFLLVLSVSGMLMLAEPWSDRWKFGDAAVVSGYAQKTENNANATKPLSLDVLYKKVADTYPGARVTQYIPPVSAEEAAVFRIRGSSRSPRPGTWYVFMNPYTGEQTGEFANADRLYTIADDIHGTLLVGKTGDALIEAAAGLIIVLMITGLWLHWPKNASGFRSFIRPFFIIGLFLRRRTDQSLSGRRFWKEIHTSLGVWLSVFLVFFALTGLAWTGIWGQKLVQPWNTFPAEKRAGFWQSGTAHETLHETLNAGANNEVPWNLEQAPMPLSAKPDRVPLPLTLDQVMNIADQQGFVIEENGAFSQRFRISLPRDEEGVYTVMSVTTRGDISNPFNDRTLHLDQYSGEVLADIGWDDYGAGARMMAAGIALHKGKAGWWNLILAAVVCCLIIFLAVTGVVLWARRGWRLPADYATEKTMPGQKLLLSVLVICGIIFPLSGVALCVFWMLDYTVFRLKSGAKAFTR